MRFSAQYGHKKTYFLATMTDEQKEQSVKELKQLMNLKNQIQHRCYI